MNVAALFDALNRDDNKPKDELGLIGGGSRNAESISTRGIDSVDA